MPSRLTAVLVSLLLATPAVAFWLWLVIVPARVAILCPEECRCDRLGYDVGCYSETLTAVPVIHLTDVRVLSLYRNKIKLLENNSFVSQTELQILQLREIGLIKIELGAFNGLTKLTILTLSSNSISEIIPGTFECTKILEHLDLGFNKLQHLGPGVFSGLFNLQYIYLSQNRLQYIHPDTFIGSTNLQSLKLDFNPDLQIPTDRNFINSKSLSRLRVSACNISSVSVETFANVSALQRLDLSNNNLSTVDIKILKALPKLSELHLYGNPLQCDCQLQEVWRWCEDRNIQTGTRRKVPHCYTPTEVKGMCWRVLESGQCLEGNIDYYGDYKIGSCGYPVFGISKKDFDGSFLKQYKIPVYVILFIFSTTGNVILLVIIICNKDMRTVPNMYILNLAISDIVYLTVLLSEACVSRMNYTWIYEENLCIFFLFSRRLSVGLSAYSVALYSIQRYRVTVNPLQVRLSSPPTWRNIVATFCGVWIVAALFAVPSTLSRYLCLEIVFTKLAYYQRVVIFELLVSCVLPLIVIAFTYTMTARHLVKSSRSISEGIQNPHHETRRYTARIVVGLTVVFLISYMPYHVFWTYFIWTQDDVISPTYIFWFSYFYYKYQYLISECFLLINPCLNPVALFCTSSQFRRHLKRYFSCFCKNNSPPTELELARRN